MILFAVVKLSSPKSEFSNGDPMVKVQVQISLSHRYHVHVTMCMRIINKRSIDPRLNNQWFRYHILSQPKENSKINLCNSSFSFIPNRFDVLTTGERDKYTKTSQTKTIKLQLKIFIYSCFVLHNPFKTNLKENLKYSKYLHHLMLLNWKWFLWQNTGIHLGDLYL